MAILEVQQATEQLEEWIPEKMEPGTMFSFDNPLSNPNWPHSRFVGVFSCPNPKCGLIGLVTHDQAIGLSYMICGSHQCSAEYRFERRLDGGLDIEFRKPA